jgi:GNAT superfamily N-acetyltransferase
MTIETPGDDAAVHEFIAFHDTVYAERSSRWPAFPQFQRALLTGSSPYNEDRLIHPLVARDAGRIVARVVAVVDTRYQRHWNEPLGHLIWFEALPDTRGAVRQVLDAGCDWLAGHGCGAARMGSGVLEFPFAVDAYDALPPAWLRQNPAYYHPLLEDAGFTTERGFVDYRITVRPELVQRWQRWLRDVEQVGFRVVPLRDVPGERRAAQMTRVWNEAFSAHWGFTPFSEAEVMGSIRTFGPAGMLDTSVLAYRDDQPVGALWVVPETTNLAATVPGHVVPAAERLNVLGIAVLASARGRGVNLGMAAYAYLELVRRGATHLSYTLVLDDNWPSRRTAEKLGAEVCANYVAYRREFRR